VSVFDLWREGLEVAAVVAAPFLLGALAVGLITSLIQAATQIQENVLSFVPKLIAVGLVLALGGNLLLDKLSRYATASIEYAITAEDEARRDR
jgi:flagellar biosynthetic protein FliQ